MLQEELGVATNAGHRGEAAEQKSKHIVGIVGARSGNLVELASYIKASHSPLGIVQMPAPGWRVRSFLFT